MHGALTAAALLLAAHQKTTLMDDAVLDALRGEVSGAIAQAHVTALSRFHRVQASEGYRRAAEYVRDRAREYGLEDAQIEKLPADGETRYHHFRSYYGWEAEEGSLWEVSPRRERIADYEEMRVALADYSQDAELTAELVDVGEGTGDEEYAGKEVSGTIVLAGGALTAVHREAVIERGAEGIVSYFPNQRTGWSGDDPDLVRWGHLDPFETRNRFAFMVSPRKAGALRARLAAGESIRLSAKVRARLVPGDFAVVTAVLPGADLPEEEIVFTCHLDHQSPGANDNASGAAVLLEVARSLSRLVKEGRIPPPRRSIRFIWPPEIAGTFAYLATHPEIVSRFKAGIHMDMVGGAPSITKSVFFLSRPPASIPSFVGDVAEVFFDYVALGARRLAAQGDASEAIVSPEGSKEDFLAEVQGLDLGSDHQVLGHAFFGVPMVYFHDWPDIYIHTNKDRPENMDPTKLQRVAFLGAATGYTMARIGPEEAPALTAVTAGRGLERIGRDQQRALGGLTRADAEDVHRAYYEARNRIEHAYRREQDALGSIAAYSGAPSGSMRSWIEMLTKAGEASQVAARALYEQMCRRHGTRPRDASSLVPDPGPAARRVPVRTEAVRGPLELYYFDTLAERLGEEAAAVDLPGTVAYEILNFADGRRSVAEIRDAVSAEVEPVPIEAVLAYLDLLEKAEVIAYR